MQSPFSYINIDGKITTAADGRIPVDNGAFRYGYGVFETMLVQNGEIRMAEDHFKRLFNGAAQLYFEWPVLMTADWLEAQVLRTVSRNGLEQLCRVRLQLFAGGGGLFSNESRHPGFLIECFPIEPETPGLNENGLIAGIATGMAKSIDTHSNLKTCNALIYAIAARQAKANKWNDALVVNTDSHIIESSIANIFWIKDDIVYTPPLSDGCVAGVMRQHIIRTIDVTEKHLTVLELLQADEVFLTNAIKKMRWVSRIADTVYTNQNIQNIYTIL